MFGVYVLSFQLGQMRKPKSFALVYLFLVVLVTPVIIERMKSSPPLTSPSLTPPAAGTVSFKAQFCNL